MKWMQLYLLGYAVVLGGLVAALSKMGVIERVGPGWTAIGIVIAVWLGFMISVADSGSKDTVEIDAKR
jgi:hypothetical protein